MQRGATRYRAAPTILAVLVALLARFHMLLMRSTARTTAGALAALLARFLTFTGDALRAAGRLLVALFARLHMLLMGAATRWRDSKVGICGRAAAPVVGTIRGGRHLASLDAAAYHLGAKTWLQQRMKSHF
jgi:hypothetical protein